MQDQISHTVRLGIWPPPDLFVAQSLQTALYLGEILVGQVVPRALNERMCDFVFGIRGRHGNWE
jgi:hypothetical protein